MSTGLPEPTIRMNVDPTNPGQFFACCGLLELASRLWPDTAARFVDETCFEIVGVPAGATIQNLIEQLQTVGLMGALTPELAAERSALEVEYTKSKKSGQKLPDAQEARRKYLGGLLRAGAITVGEPFRLLLDWWQADSDEVPKTWAGSMQVRRVAMAALAECPYAFTFQGPFEHSCVLRPVDDDADDEEEGESIDEGKAEPFYFDSTRGTHATPLDIGFSPNKLSVIRPSTRGNRGRVKLKQAKMESEAFPAVEFLALIGLQRFRPMPTNTPRVFDYCAWTVALPPSIAAAAACGLLPGTGGESYRFENGFRTDQRKHKGFLPASRITEGETR